MSLTERTMEHFKYFLAISDEDLEEYEELEEADLYEEEETTLYPITKKLINMHDLLNILPEKMGNILRDVIVFRMDNPTDSPQAKEFINPRLHYLCKQLESEYPSRTPTPESIQIYRSTMRAIVKLEVKGGES